MTELLSVNIVLFISILCECTIFIAPTRVSNSTTILNATPAFLALCGFLVILKDINVIPDRYKIHNWITWLPIEMIVCLAMTEFAINLIWYRIEEIVEILVKRIMMENDTTLYYDAGGDSLVNFILILMSGGFFVFTIFITNTVVKTMDSVEMLIKYTNNTIRRLCEKFKSSEETIETNLLQPDAEIIEPVQDNLARQCITICSPELFERCGDANPQNTK